MSTCKRITKYLLPILCTALLPLSSFAATSVQVNTAITNGLNYLASQQQANGSWYYGGYEVAATSAAVLAMLEQGSTESTGPYKTYVQKGLQYLFNQASYDVANSRVWWGPEDSYQTGLALSAISASKTPNDFVSSGVLSGLTYKQVAQNTVKYFAEGQNSPANNGISNQYRGGWHYGFQAGDSDNSTAQWPVVGMLFARTDLGVSIPSSVPTELTYWTNYIQNLNGTPATNPLHGSSGYMDP